LVRHRQIAWEQKIGRLAVDLNSGSLRKGHNGDSDPNPVGKLMASAREWASTQSVLSATPATIAIRTKSERLFAPILVIKFAR